MNSACTKTSSLMMLQRRQTADHLSDHLGIEGERKEEALDNSECSGLWIAVVAYH